MSFSLHFLSEWCLLSLDSLHTVCLCYTAPLFKTGIQYTSIQSCVRQMTSTSVRPLHGMNLDLCGLTSEPWPPHVPWAHLGASLSRVQPAPAGPTARGWGTTGTNHCPPCWPGWAGTSRWDRWPTFQQYRGGGHWGLCSLSLNRSDLRSALQHCTSIYNIESLLWHEWRRWYILEMCSTLHPYAYAPIQQASLCSWEDSIMLEIHTHF